MCIRDRGTSSQVDEPRKVIVRSAEEFQTLWKSHSTAPLPKVDFSKSIVVGVFLGMRPTAGYTVGIQAVRRTEGGAAKFASPRPRWLALTARYRCAPEAAVPCV